MEVGHRRSRRGGAWELCKWGFGVYVNWTVRGANWYGPFVMLPLFMLWIYLTWSAILLGLHVAYMHQYYPLLKRQYFFTRMGRSAISDLRWVLPLGVLLYRQFKGGKDYAYDAAVVDAFPRAGSRNFSTGWRTRGWCMARGAAGIRWQSRRPRSRHGSCCRRCAARRRVRRNC